ncbi:hypothetical protein E1202_07960 [Saccharopolyspora karakumensis]|uniref:Uncharacterized protein n=1 Tax=Saccharopolyspora karakumensis TaxID=2530386 RepID=A0A4R5C1A6_9PSEU|nr:hypothetical protein E1202_07960 [Saccharopolyspora karakumensis]
MAQFDSTARARRRDLAETLEVAVSASRTAVDSRFCPGTAPVRSDRVAAASHIALGISGGI